jgi:hypothetical protein
LTINSTAFHLYGIGGYGLKIYLGKYRVCPLTPNMGIFYGKSEQNENSDERRKGFLKDYRLPPDNPLPVLVI